MNLKVPYDCFSSLYIGILAATETAIFKNRIA